MKNFLAWLDNSVVGGVLTLLVLGVCFILFWVSTPSGLDKPAAPQTNRSPVLVRDLPSMQTQGYAQDGHEFKKR